MDENIFQASSNAPMKANCSSGCSAGRMATHAFGSAESAHVLSVRQPNSAGRLKASTDMTTHCASGGTRQTRKATSAHLMKSISSKYQRWTPTYSLKATSAVA
eukprot:2597652-Prymnesium_polylepis.1